MLLKEVLQTLVESADLLLSLRPLENQSGMIRKRRQEVDAILGEQVFAAWMVKVDGAENPSLGGEGEGAGGA